MTQIPKKIALTIGIEYVKSSISTLKGTYNDSMNMTRFLMENGYKVTNMNDTNYQVSSTKYPSKRNIVYWLNRLLSEANNGDRVVITYAGHGAQLQANRTSNFEELDNRDETLIPADYNYAHDTALTDDELHALLKKYLANQPDTEVFILCDCCHSGTMADLKYTYNYINGQFKLHDDKTTNDIDSRVVMISGCRDDQVSWGALVSHDTDGNKGKKTNQGVLTSSFIHALKKVPNITSNVFDIVKHMYKYTAPYKQQPQISSTHNLGIDKHILSDIAKTKSKPTTTTTPKNSTKPVSRPSRVNKKKITKVAKTKKVATSQDLYLAYRKKLGKKRKRYRYRYRDLGDRPVKTNVVSGFNSILKKN